MAAASESIVRRPRRSVRPYVAVAVLATVVALAGFWTSYFGPLLAGTEQARPIIHVHAAVFVGWLALVIAQATFASRGNMRLHVATGRAGFVYGIVLIVAGVATALAMFASRVAAGDFESAQARLFAPITDMVVFAPVLGAAWAYRDRPEIHKRLIVVATTILLVAAVHRMHYLGGRPPPWPQLMLVWLSPILVGMAYDALRLRIVHPVYLLGIAVIVFLKFGRLPLARSDAWWTFSEWLATRIH